MTAVAATALAVCLFALVPSGARAQQAAGSPSGSVVELAADIRDKTSPAAALPQPAALLRTVSGFVESGGARPPVKRHFERMDNGLWGITQVISVRGALIRRTLSLHGLVQLASVSEIDRDYDSQMTLPLGQAFQSFTVQQNLKASGSTNTTQLDADVPALLSPKAGAAFSFTHAWEARTVTTTSGLFGGTQAQSFKLSLQQECSVGPELDATTLHADLRGKMMRVACAGALANGTARRDEYAFLADSGLYLLLASSFGSNTDKYVISGVEYAAP